MKDLVAELDRNSNDKGLMIQLLALQILMKIARIWVETSGWTNERSNMYVRKAISFMHNNYDRDIGISDIAEALNIHYGYLYRLFKVAMAKTPLDHLNEIRIEKAKNLLINTNIPVIEVSDYIGVNGSQYFSKFFKKYTGLTPKQYRDGFSRLHTTQKKL
jgi:YesN/AraC family two-component response regulator